MYTIEGAAMALGITPGAVRKAIGQGRLTPQRFGARTLLLEPAEVERYRATPKHAGGRPGRGTGGDHVTIAVELSQHAAERTRITVGRLLWEAMGSPKRIKVLARPLRLAPAAEGEGYAVTTGMGAPRFLVTGLDVSPGTYSGELAGKAIVLRPKVWIV